MLSGYNEAIHPVQACADASSLLAYPAGALLKFPGWGVTFLFLSSEFSKAPSVWCALGTLWRVNTPVPILCWQTNAVLKKGTHWEFFLLLCVLRLTAEKPNQWRSHFVLMCGAGSVWRLCDAHTNRLLVWNWNDLRVKKGTFCVQVTEVPRRS